MNNPFDPASAAALLVDAWRSGELLKELPAPARPTTLAQGYDAQDRFVAALGQKVVGWKLGVGSIAQKKQSGIGRSIAGRIFESRLHESGSTVVLPSAAPVTMEFEIAYVLGRDIRPDEPEFHVPDAVAEVRTSFELVLSRFTDRRAVGWPSFAADNAAFNSLVLGKRIDPTHLAELDRTLVVLLDGKEAARAATGDDRTDPMGALADLVALGRERGMTLPKGSVISTGTVSKPFNVAAPAAEISALFLGTELGFRTRVDPKAWKSISGD
jgi:2-keto-4-pentenoate hydratase